MFGVVSTYACAREHTRGGEAKMSLRDPEDETEGVPGILGFQRRLHSPDELERLRWEAVLHKE
jgi:hypothetical protein